MKRMDQLLYIVVRWVIRRLGRISYPVSERIAARLGRFFFAIAGKHRRIAMDNLTMAFGEEKSAIEIENITRQVFVNLVRIVFEVSRADRWDNRQLASHVRFSGLEDLQRALAKGRGAILLGAHFGSWELQPLVIRLAGVEVAIAYRTLDTPALDRLFKEIRSSRGALLIPNQRGAMRKFYRTIRDGHCAGLLMDQGVDFDDGVFVDFFRRPAATNTGMALMAMKSKAPVVPFFLIRGPGNIFQAVFGPELPFIETNDRTKDIEENTQLYNQVIEAYVRRFPDQWFWVHQRWKNLPFCPWPRTNPRVSNRY